MKRLFFDITDIIEFSKNNREVTGIQRVGIRLLASLAKNYPPEQIRCIYHSATGSTMEFSASDAFKSNVTLQDILRSLEIFPRTRLLNKASLKDALSQYNHRKLYRGVKKMELYLAAAFFPWKLRALGYHNNIPDANKNIDIIKQLPAKPLNQGDAYVLLGPNWNNQNIISFADRTLKCGGRVAQLIHDIIPVVAPSFFNTRTRKKYKSYLSTCGKFVNQFICVSEKTKADLLQFLNHTEIDRDCTVLPLAHEFYGTERNSQHPWPSSAKLPSLGRQAYVLCVGTIEPRKNAVSLLKAWQKIHQCIGDATPILIFAGKFGWMTNEFIEAFNSLGPIGTRVMHYDSPTDKDLASLYSNCLFTVYPSHYEGWGLPVGESLWFGKTCIASCSSSIPEVGGDTIDYFHPKDIEALADKAMKLILDLSYLKNQEGLAKIMKLRTWDEVAKNLFHQLTGERGSKENSLSQNYFPHHSTSEK